MPEETDVTQDGSSPSEGTEAHAETPAVTGEAAQSGRTYDNLAGEFNRKFGKLQTQLETVMQYIATQAQRPAAVTPAQGQQGQPTDADLWSLAQQGDQAAFTEYQRRIAAREYDQRSQVDRHAQMVTTQLNTLVSKYPVLRDANHPLTQAAHQAYSILTANGYPATQATLLEAAKTAIADNPGIISDLHSQPAQNREQVRQTATQRAQTGVMGAQHRQSNAPPQGQAPKMTAEKLALAQRMGVKDPEGAMKRFMERQKNGQSSLGSVGMFVNEGDL